MLVKLALLVVIFGSLFWLSLIGYGRIANVISMFIALGSIVYGLYKWRYDKVA